MKKYIGFSVCILIFLAALSGFITLACENPIDTLVKQGVSSYQVPVLTVLVEDVEVPIEGSHDFGSAVAGEIREKTFTISNTGHADLELTGTNKIVVDGSEMFTVTQYPVTPISIGESSTFIIRFTAGSLGESRADIRIESNDAGQSDFFFSVKGATEAAGKLAVPVFDLLPGDYQYPQSLSITAGSGSQIIYSVDPADSDLSQGSTYPGPIFLGTSKTVRAKAVKQGYIDSDIIEGTFNIGICLQPVMSPAAGIYYAEQSVSLTTETGGASIRYTTDGVTVPTDTIGTVYSGTPVTVNQNMTVRAIASLSGFSNSSVTEAVYNMKVAEPQFSPAPGAYVGAQTVSISVAPTTGANIRYTDDGTSPDSGTGTLYSTDLTVDVGGVYSAVGYRTNWDDSPVSGGTYEIFTAEDQSLLASDGSAEAEFAASAALSADGNTLVVGAPEADVGGNDRQGAVYIYNYSGSWTETGILQASDGTANQLFGTGVAVSSDGSRIVVTTDSFSNSRIYIFSWNGSGWDEQSVSGADGNLSMTPDAQYIVTGWSSSPSVYYWNGSTYVLREAGILPSGVTLDSDADYGRFFTISADGQRLLVSAYRQNISQPWYGNDWDCGEVYVFSWNGSSYEFIQQFIHEEEEIGMRFGFGLDVSSDGNTVVVGGATKSFVFAWNGSSYQQEQVLIPFSFDTTNHLYRRRAAVSDDGNVILVGDRSDLALTNEKEGSAYVYVKNLGTWDLDRQLIASDHGYEDFFSDSVTISADGSRIAVGAKFNDISGTADQGAVYVYDR